MSFAGLGSSSLWGPDEPRVASIGRAMFESGELAAAKLNGELFLEQPPLYYWVQALAFRLFGISDAVARLPSAFFGMLTLLVAFVMGARIAGPRAGLLALAVLATTPGFFSTAHECIVDPSLAFFVSLGHLGFICWHAPRLEEPIGRRRERLLGALTIALAVPLAFLAKGPVGAALALGPPFLYLLATRQFRALGGAWLPAVLLALSFTVIVGGWLLALYRNFGPGAVQEFCLQENLARFTGGRNSHDHPFWYYLKKIDTFLPWVAILPAALLAGGWGRGREADNEPRRALLACFFFGILLLSIPSSKRGLYLVPLAPALAAIAGSWLARLDSPAARGPLCRPTALLSLIGLAVAPLVLLGAAVLLEYFPATFASLDAPAPLEAALTPGRLAAVAAITLAASGLFSWAALRHLRAGSTPRPALLLAPLCLYFLIYQIPIRGFVEPIHSMRPFTDAVARFVPAGGPVASYVAGEEVVGIIHFNLGRPVRALRSESELRAFLGDSPGEPFVFALKKSRRIPGDIRARLRFIYDETATADTPCAIAVQERGVEN
jgi:4-amino-4-deoxy-L-arabinose transferase-like glycosyltransferase